MNFRSKAFLYSSLVVIAVTALVFAGTQSVVKSQFLRLEEEEIRQDAARVQEIIGQELSTLAEITEKWAVHPDVYNFIVDEGHNTPGQSVIVMDFETLDLEVVLLFNNRQEYIYGRSVNPFNHRQQSVAADLRALPQNYDLFPPTGETTDARNGIVNTSRGILLLSSRAVKATRPGGAPVGFLVFGRYLDPTFQEELGQLTGLSIEAWSIDDPELPADYRQAASTLQQSSDPLTLTMPGLLGTGENGGKTAYAYLALDDLNGNRQFILRLEDDLQYYQVGMKAVRQYGLLIILIGLICGGATYLYFDRSLIARLAILHEGINRFRETHNFDQRLEVEGNDELAKLVNTWNTAISELGKYHDGQIKSERQFREALQNLSLAAVILDIDGRIIFCNDYLANISGWQPQDLTGRYWCSQFVPEEQQPECRKEIAEAARTGRITAHEDTPLVLRNGSTRTFNWSNTLLVSEDEQVAGIVRIGEDVTEQRKSEALLRESLRQTRLHLSRLNALRNIDAAITSSMDTPQKLEHVLATIQESLDVDAVDILRLDQGANTLVPIAVRDLPKDAFKSQPYLLSDPVLMALRENNQPLMLHNQANDNLPQWTKMRLVDDTWIEFYGAAPMISGSRLIGVLEVFARQSLETDEGWLEHFKSMALQAAITLENDEMVQGIQRANLELAQAYEGTLLGWARALELRDKETRGHSERMMELTMRLGRRLGMNTQQLEDIARGVLLHDIGKMGVPDYILHKPGPLTEEEWVVMRQHPQFAYNLLKNIPYLAGALEVAYCHHEHWDGSGYPRGLKGEEIPFNARIFTIVDVWDALTHDRPYRPAWPEEEALNYIRSKAGSEFDPALVEAFIKMQQDSLLRQTAPLPVHFDLD